MATCSAAEIAEKRRIALAKLHAKQKGLITTSNALKASANEAINKNQNKIYDCNLKVPENSFKEALNALKQSTKIAPYTRDTARATTHHIHKRSRTENHSTTHSNGSTRNSTQKLSPVFTFSTTCQIYMISASRFAIQSSSFHAKLIELFKIIPSKNYDAQSRIWSFGIEDYKLLQERVNAMKPDVVIGTIPKKVLDLCMAPAVKLEPSCLASIEPKLADKLLSFQQEGVCFAIAQNGNIMICDEMGLGKTYQALAVADFYREDWPLLICTTASTRDSWSSHVRELLPSVPLHLVDVFLSNDQYIGDAKVLIVSYTMLATHVEKLERQKYGFLIFDESHQLKSSKAKCSKAADLLARKAKHVVLLSGTPALSRPLELFTQLQLVDRKFMNFMEFTTRYCDGKQSNFGWDASGQSNLQELNVVLKLKYMLRRTKADVLPDMAEKYRETVVLDPSLVWPDDDVKATLSKLTKDFTASKGKEKEEILLHFYAQTASVKTKAVCSYLKTLLKEKIKFIVFGHHRVMLDAVTDCLKNLKANFIRIDGQTRNDLRAEYINRFQTNPSCQVAVLSLRACNSGITLTAAEMIVFTELDWNPSTLAQAESRAHRIGQDKPVTCRYLMASKTADDVIWNMLKNKQDVLNRAGLFCENLQEAKTTAAPTMSNKIEQYFSPDKNKVASDKNIESKSSKKSVFKEKVLSVTTPTKTSGNKELEVARNNSNIEVNGNKNLEELFSDDDAFNDILF